MSYSHVPLRETHIIGAATRELLISPQLCSALSLYHIVLAGISYALPPFRFERLRPTMSQILVCAAGQGRVWIDGGWVDCTPGMAYVTPPGIFHAYHVMEDVPWQLAWVNYEVEHAVITVERPTLLQVDPQELVLALNGLYSEGMGMAEEAVMQQWAQLIHVYARRMVGPKLSDVRLQRLWKQIDSNLAHPWNAEELAALVGLSSEQLRRLCQQQFGCSPMKQVTAMRMQRAMALFTSDSYSVDAVAQRVGYDNPFAFSTAFKRHVGMPPSVYRDQTRQ
ncbi:AraC family transcriptional regulator [Dictyobacter arantiisoli]|uniref:AraC family transcriptional regulator n=1 Tax=Dictyobacter arantiisoli TaxID=2014874 RepID=A0A5A5TJW4_9CHLR|nr:AraC family transcriptional regulator [Dictyobacter arantiisoli]GCF11366.1 AraC family transcriptional regulator [Dictyobacter arantiisoli]